MLGSVCPARQIKEHQSVCLVESSPLRKRGLRLHAMALIRVTQVESVSSVIEVSMQPEQKKISPAVIYIKIKKIGKRIFRQSQPLFYMYL